MRTGGVFLRDPHKNRQRSPVFWIFCVFEGRAGLEKKKMSHNLVQSWTLKDQESNDFHYHNTNIMFSENFKYHVSSPLYSWTFCNLPG